jgi:deoxyadenosine/deoxycytidine kinase
MNKKNNSNNTTSNNNNNNKILSDYFNSMYTDCIQFCNSVNNEHKINININQCDFIKEKIHKLNPKTTNNNLTPIIYAVAK